MEKKYSDFRNLLKELKKELEKNSTDTYRKKIEDAFNLYKNRLFIYLGDHKFENNEELINIVHSNIGRIYNVWADYSKGYIFQSLSRISNLINLIETQKVKAGESYYRMRTVDAGETMFEEAEMFHIPFNLRGNVKTQRYSLPGFPCLYLSDSVETAWLEMGQPAFEYFCVSKIKLSEDLQVLNLAFPYIEDEGLWDNNINDRKISDYIKNLPLIISCSIRVNESDKNNPFKAEYTIPQMIMLSIMKNKDIDGCMYSSTKRHEKLQNKHINLALPAKVANVNETKQGYSSLLSGKFEITKPIKYNDLIINGNAFAVPIWEEDEIPKEFNIFLRIEAELKEVKGIKIKN